ncbi:carboxypeptidase M32 [bacterium]|nr:carboxypeptidase M32 [Verrucomicrobiales bacterium]MDC3255159.1 carboxypeptidase M32 [bacterium]MDF1788819.1 carboxypeptidase M32 [Verrucomicrobiales bacterium]
MNAYQDLVQRHEEIALLQACNALLSWDQETNLPAKGVAYRAQQRAALSEKVHELKTSDDVTKWLDACQDDADGEAIANVQWWRHAYERARKIPATMVGEFEEVTSLGLAAWQEAREKSDYVIFQSHLQKIVDFNRQMADLWGYEDSPYDALLEEYERGATAKNLASLFADLKGPLVELVDAAIAKSANQPPRSLQGNYPIEAQQAFNLEVCQALGFDLEAGRIDTAAHPFCSRLAPNDTRLTTRYDTSDFTSSFFGVLHETGHGLYEQGLPQDKHALPSGTAVSLGIHESQSRLWENQIGRSRAFWDHWLPVAQKHFPSLTDWTPEDMTRAVNQAERTFIRVEADEVTYDLHILLRFELEKQLIEGSLSVADLPEAWNTAFEDLTNLTVPDHANGCLQDIHWSMGALGYFPTYSLGNLNAAQLHAAALDQVLGLSNDLAKGNYASLLQWLQTNIHAHGSQLLPEELMTKATGRSTEIAPYLKHLRSRYVDGS